MTGLPQSELPNQPASSQYRTPIIETALVINVDTENYTVDALAEMSARRYTDIPFMQPYAHYMNGEGIYFMPEAGAPCWVCVPSEGDKAPFVLGFGSVYDADGSYKNLKRSLNQGDIFLGTRDDNFVILRRGGILQLGGGPACQRMYIPLGNYIRDFCQSYELHTLGGDLTWTVEREEEDTEGDSPIILSLGTREKASDAKTICVLTAGHHDDDETAAQLKIFSTGGDDQTETMVLTIKKSGEVSWDVEDALSFNVKKDINFISEEGNVLIQSAAGTVEVSAKTTLKLVSEAQVVVDCPDIRIGSEAASTAPMLATEELIAFLTTHTHNVTAVGSPSGVPTPVPQGYLSQKVRME